MTYAKTFGCGTSHEYLRYYRRLLSFLSSFRYPAVALPFLCADSRSTPSLPPCPPPSSTPSHERAGSSKPSTLSTVSPRPSDGSEFPSSCYPPRRPPQSLPGAAPPRPLAPLQPAALISAPAGMAAAAAASPPTGLDPSKKSEPKRKGAGKRICVIIRPRDREKLQRRRRHGRGRERGRERRRERGRGRECQRQPGKIRRHGYQGGRATKAVRMMNIPRFLRLAPPRKGNNNNNNSSGGTLLANSRKILRGDRVPQNTQGAGIVPTTSKAPTMRPVTWGREETQR